MAETKVYDVKIKSDSGKVVDEKQVVVGSTTAENESDEEATVDVQISATEKTSVTVSNSSSEGVRVNFKSEAEKVQIGSIEIFIPAINGELVWGETIEKTNNITASARVIVPKKSKATYEYVGTKGTFTIPFSYTQEDKNNVKTEHTDGIYTVVQLYNFELKANIQPL